MSAVCGDVADWGVVVTKFPCGHFKAISDGWMWRHAGAVIILKLDHVVGFQKFFAGVKNCCLIPFGGKQLRDTQLQPLDDIILPLLPNAGLTYDFNGFFPGHN